MLGGGILASGAAVVNDLLDQLFQLVEDVLRLIDIFDAGYELPSRETHYLRVSTRRCMSTRVVN